MGIMYDRLKIIGNHPEIRNVRRRIRRVAPQDLNVIIYGEAGTEKELVAREIHLKSLRDPDIFEALDCCELIEPDPDAAEEILQQTFTNAQEGTLFLDNIDVMPPAIQQKLYYMLTARKKPVIPAPVQKPRGVRIIAATTDYDYEEHNGFNKHLALLINRYAITVAPVRKRKSDIPLLFDYYYTLAAEKHGYKEKPAVSDEIFQSILTYEWKGNLEEMKNTINALLDMSPKDELSPEALPFIIPENPMKFLEHFDYHTALAKVEEYLIRRALEHSGWNQTRAAQFLNMSEGNIRLKIKKYAIKKE